MELSLCQYKTLSLFPKLISKLKNSVTCLWNSILIFCFNNSLYIYNKNVSNIRKQQ